MKELSKTVVYVLYIKYVVFENCINLQSVYIRNSLIDPKNNSFDGTVIADMTSEDLQSSSSYRNVTKTS